MHRDPVLLLLLASGLFVMLLAAWSWWRYIGAATDLGRTMAARSSALAFGWLALAVLYALLT